jgi:hypothetical protein
LCSTIFAGGGGKDNVKGVIQMITKQRMPAPKRVKDREALNIKHGRAGRRTAAAVGRERKEGKGTESFVAGGGGGDEIYSFFDTRSSCRLLRPD